MTWLTHLLAFLVGGFVGLLVGGLANAARRSGDQLEDEWRHRMGGDREFTEHRDERTSTDELRRSRLE